MLCLNKPLKASKKKDEYRYNLLLVSLKSRQIDDISHTPKNLVLADRKSTFRDIPKVNFPDPGDKNPGITMVEIHYEDKLLGVILFRKQPVTTAR